MTPALRQQMRSVIEDVLDSSEHRTIEAVIAAIVEQEPKIFGQSNQEAPPRDLPIGIDLNNVREWLTLGPGNIGVVVAKQHFNPWALVAAIGTGLNGATSGPSTAAGIAGIAAGITGLVASFSLVLSPQEAALAYALWKAGGVSPVANLIAPANASFPAPGPFANNNDVLAVVETLISKGANILDVNGTLFLRDIVF